MTNKSWLQQGYIGKPWGRPNMNYPSAAESEDRVTMMKSLELSTSHFLDDAHIDDIVAGW